MNKDIDLIIDELLIERGEHPSRVRNPIYSEERELAKKAVQRILSPSPMEGKTEEENFYCAEWNKVGFRCDVGQCEKCAKEEGKKPLKGSVILIQSNFMGRLIALYSDVDPIHLNLINNDDGVIAIIDLSKHYEGEGL